MIVEHLRKRRLKRLMRFSAKMTNTKEEKREKGDVDALHSDVEEPAQTLCFEGATGRPTSRQKASSQALCGEAVTTFSEAQTPKMTNRKGQKRTDTGGNSR